MPTPRPECLRVSLGLVGALLLDAHQEWMDPEGSFGLKQPPIKRTGGELSPVKGWKRSHGSVTISTLTCWTMVDELAGLAKIRLTHQTARPNQNNSSTK